MCDAPSVRCDSLGARSEHRNAQPEMLRPRTPLPDSTRTLHRTISHASIDTVLPSNNKGIRRRITEIAAGHKSAKKKKNLSSAHDVSKDAAHGLGAKVKTHPKSKATKRERQAATSLGDSSRTSKQGAPAIDNSPHTGMWSDRISPLTVQDYEPGSLLDEPPPKDELLKDCGFPTGDPDLARSWITAECQHILHFSRTKANIKDVQLHIQPSTPEMTIWDGLQDAHHVFPCRLFLQCTSRPYNAASLPNILRVEMSCHTQPVGSRYASAPVLQTVYGGASSIGLLKDSDGIPKLNAADGIHMNGLWRTMLNRDNTWGWYRDTFVPLSSRLFDKMDYREFRLVSRVWIAESWVKAELTFGISMLLRGLDME